MSEKLKQQKIEFFNKLSKKIRRKSNYYTKDLIQFFKSLIPEGKKVLEIGCGSGDVLHAVKPKGGVGVDFSSGMIHVAKRRHPSIDYKQMDAESLTLKQPFNYVIMSDLVGHLTDVWSSFRELHKVCDHDTKVIITYYNYLWQPILKVAEFLGLKTKVKEQNWLYLDDIENLLNLNHFTIVRKGYRQLIPIYIPLISWLFNDFIAKLPLIRNLCLVQYIIARKEDVSLPKKEYSCTILIPCKNEKDNVEPGVTRLPAFGSKQEILFVDGNSTDGTVEEIKRVMKKYPKKNIRFMSQGKGRGKGDAVRQGFLAAKNDVLMILDADLTVPPEDLPKFYLAIKEGKAQFVNGSRLVYPQEKEAMRYINLFGNWMFGKIFSWVMEQRVRDTLCGTKVLFKHDYMVLRKYRAYFNNMDPFGDFDLLFGASKMNLDIVEMPIRYRERTYGTTKIRRFYHGWILIKMSLLGMRKLKLR